MIAFACPNCGMKFQLKDEFAGRATKCPTCKSALTVPAADVVQTAPVPGYVGHVANNPGQAGIAGVTLVLKQKGANMNAGPRSVSEVLSQPSKSGERYIVESEIARGGMGAVLRAVDSDIRREVALKFLLDPSNLDKTRRFIEEAQITGQLEHPNIVPVHELGKDAKERVFFSMKMVKGRSLAQILDDLRDNSKAVSKEYSLGRLLTILVSVCNALAYAHALGVVHRDLKPANIMVGDFGEVYVMDWGLAKVLPEGEEPIVDVDSFTPNLAGRPGAAAADTVSPSRASGTDSASGSGRKGKGAASTSSVDLGAPSRSSSPSSSGKVVTNQRSQTDITVDGTIMGTPMYMPPEQASGQVQAIGRHSDIYSLGAILYEILTLEPPIARGDSYLAILMQVIEGNIVRPELRNPQRARQGKIPADLSAIAMKALARQPADRYASVEDLRRDLELFLEGRSVSAKEDTKKELFIKFVKRNQAFSATAAAALVVVLVILMGSSWINYRARLHADQARMQAEQAAADMRKAQKEKAERTVKAVPALVDAARHSVDKRQFDSAFLQVNLALDYNPEFEDAVLLRGQLSILRKNFAAARKDLEQYLKKRPGNASVQLLRDRCSLDHPDSDDNLLVMAQALVEQQQHVLAEGLLKQNAYKARFVLLDMYRTRINKAWKDLNSGSRLTLDASGIYSLNLNGAKEIADLTPLRGIPITRLYLHGCTDVRDLSPLHDLPLVTRELTNCGRVRDLKPLAGMALKELVLSATGVHDLTPLKGAPLKKLLLHNCKDVQDLAPLQGMPLATLELNGCNKITDLAALKGMPLTSLNLAGTLVRDLTPLTGMKLVSITLPSKITRGLEVLRKMPSLTMINNRPAEIFWEKRATKE